MVFPLFLPFFSNLHVPSSVHILEVLHATGQFHVLIWPIGRVSSWYTLSNWCNICSLVIPAGSLPSWCLHIVVIYFMLSNPALVGTSSINSVFHPIWCRVIFLHPSMMYLFWVLMILLESIVRFSSQFLELVCQLWWFSVPYLYQRGGPRSFRPPVSSYTLVKLVTVGFIAFFDTIFLPTWIHM